MSEQSDDYFVFEVDTSVQRKAIQLPGGIKITDIITPVTGKVKEGTAYILFLQDGLFTGAIVHLLDEDNIPYTIKFKPLTGRLDFQRGYIFEEIEETRI